jgi:hypothetical protein
MTAINTMRKTIDIVLKKSGPPSMVRSPRPKNNAL